MLKNDKLSNENVTWHLVIPEICDFRNESSIRRSLLTAVTFILNDLSHIVIFKTVKYEQCNDRI